MFDKKKPIYLIYHWKLLKFFFSIIFLDWDAIMLCHLCLIRKQIFHSFDIGFATNIYVYVRIKTNLFHDKILAITSFLRLFAYNIHLCMTNSALIDW